MDQVLDGMADVPGSPAQGTGWSPWRGMLAGGLIAEGLIFLVATPLLILAAVDAARDLRAAFGPFSPHYRVDAARLIAVIAEGVAYGIVPLVAGVALWRSRKHSVGRLARTFVWATLLLNAVAIITGVPSFADSTNDPADVVGLTVPLCLMLAMVWGLVSVVRRPPFRVQFRRSAASLIPG